ncbi:MAG: NAD(+)/NADH kinase [Verrucomicrobiota bacterium]
MAAPRVGIIANTLKEGAAEIVQKTYALLNQRKVETSLEASTAQIAGLENGLPVREVALRSDCLILFGGDGTLLHLARQLGPELKPTATVNIGTLGFLTMATAEELESVIDRLCRKDYSLSHRQILSATLEEKGNPESSLTSFGVNEVAVTRGEITRLVHVEVWVDEEFVTRYSGDGVVVATPTGSTAYSLSAGGPIIEPQADAWTITPVCTHSLSSRPLVVSASASIRISAPVQRDEVFMTVDGQDSIPLGQSRTLRIQRADFTLPLITRPEASFYRMLRQKLDWSGSHEPNE